MHCTKFSFNGQTVMQSHIGLIVSYLEEIKNPVYLTAAQVKEWDEKFKLSSNEKNQMKSFPALGRMESLRDSVSYFKRTTVTESGK